MKGKSIQDPGIRIFLNPGKRWKPSVREEKGLSEGEMEVRLTEKQIDYLVALRLFLVGTKNYKFTTVTVYMVVIPSRYPRS